MATTMRDKFIAALLKRGEKQVKVTPKSIVFTCSRQPGYFYYVGKSGSLRYGSTKVTSFAANTKLKQELLTEGETAQ